MRLLIDMNLSPRWVTFFAGEGFEALHWTQIGSPKAGDIELMVYARENDFVVLTHDLDFGSMLAASGGMGPSVIQIRADDLRIETLGGRLVALLRHAADIIGEGALVTVDPVGARISILPVGKKR